MQLPDALSRCHESATVLSGSPAEDDPFFPYVKEDLGQINVPGVSNCDLLHRNETFGNDTVTSKEVQAKIPAEANSC